MSYRVVFVLLCTNIGEYQDLARIHRLTSSDHASTYVSILRHLTDYGTREYLARDSDQSDDGGDGYEDDYDFTTALALLDEDGNATGEVIVGSAGSFGDAEDEDGHDFSDDDDDDDDDKHL